MSIGDRQSQHSFAQIPDVKMTRSKFDRSYTVKDTFDFDYLIPIFVDEVIPGDTHNLTVNSFARLATQIVPIMDNMYLDYFFFFVPNRLTYDKWEKLNGAQDNPGDTTDYIMPQITSPTSTPTGFPVGSIYDKFGLPTGIATLLIKNSVPLRCYNKIYNDWFRDQNLQNSVLENTDQGPDAYADYVLLKRGKRHDYFTSSLPSPQKGPAVQLSLGTTAPIIGIAKVNTTFGSSGATGTDSTNTAVNYANAAHVDDGSANTQFIVQGTGPTGYPQIFADLSAATAGTINQLRQSIMMQSLFELDARGGTRYVEILRNHFQVISPDFRLQRSEYLGGGTVSINSHPVAQTSPTAGGNAQAQLAAFATTSTTGRENIGFSKSFVEHGYVIGLVCARGDITYQQGLNRMWQKSTRYDFFWPKLQELGEQAVLNSEIYAVAGTSTNNDVFGYQERYAEYRYKPSEIHGEFRSTYSAPIDMWHLAEDFGSLPVLNSSFIVQNTPIDRVIAINTEPHLKYDAWFKLTSARPMLTYSVPATLGRF